MGNGSVFRLARVGQSVVMLFNPRVLSLPLVLVTSMVVQGFGKGRDGHTGLSRSGGKFPG